MEALTYSVPEAAIALGIGKNTTYKLVASGRIPHIRSGRTIRIPKQSLIDWLNAEARKNTKGPQQEGGPQMCQAQ